MLGVIKRKPKASSNCSLYRIVTLDWLIAEYAGSQLNLAVITGPGSRFELPNGLISVGLNYCTYVYKRRVVDSGGMLLG
jgi:hypothetical protein